MTLPGATGVASAIRSCPAFREAVKLASGKPAGAERQRGISRGFPFGVEAGLILISGEPGVDVVGLDDEELLRRWRDGVLGVCASETPVGADDGVLLLVLAVLEVLAEKPGARQADRDFWTAVDEIATGAAIWYGVPAKNVRRSRGRYHASRLRGGGSPGLIELAADLGLVSGDLERPRITALGQLGRDLLPADLPVAADPDLPAVDLLNQVAAGLRDGEAAESWTRERITSRWIAARGPMPAAREVLAAADGGMSAAARLAAVQIARDVRYPLPEHGEYWDMIDYLAAFLERGDVDDVLTAVWAVLPGDNVEECLAGVTVTGHPAAGAVVSAVREFVASGVPRTIDQVLRLRVTQLGTGKETWRDLLLPAIVSLGDMHDAIRALTGHWQGSSIIDDETPYWFTVGDRRYGGPVGDVAGLRKALPASEIGIASALARAERIGYVFDAPVYEEYQITLVEALRRDDGTQYPSCVDYAEGPPRHPGLRGETEPFDLEAANDRLSLFREEFNDMLAKMGERGRW